MSKPIIPSYLLWAIVTVEGFVALAAQMLTIRQLMPFVGNSVVVTSLIIGLFLLALAVGYRKGGQYTQDIATRLVRNFLLAALWMGIGLSYIFLAYWFLSWPSLNTLVLLIFYLLLVTVPMVYYLGQTVPIVMNLWNTNQRAGDIGGRVLQLSTMGSFLGAVLTSIVIMNHLGLGWTVFITAGLLLILVISLLWILRKNIGSAFWAIALIIFFYWLNVLGTNHFFIASNHYAQYQVLENFSLYPGEAEGAVGDLLLINQSSSSFLTANKKGFPYIEKIKQILFDDLHLRKQNILVLGAGGFTLSAQNDYENHITYVDIDPAILEIVKKNFLPDIYGHFVAADARVFVQDDQSKYAAVVVDVYSHQLTIPAHLLTVEFFADINRILKPQGTAIFNIVMNPLLKDNYSKSIDAGLKAVFQSCSSLPLQIVNEKTNVIYICQKNENIKMAKILQEAKGRYYTDNLNRAAWDNVVLK